MKLYLPTMLRILVICTIALATPAFGVRADETTAADDEKTYDLVYKLKHGEVLRFEVDHRASARNTLEGTTEDVVTHTESVKVWKVTDVLPSGDIEFVNLVERVKMRNKMPDRAPVSYDSTTDENPAAPWDDVAASIGVPLSVIQMTSRGEIKAREVKYQQPGADAEAPIALLLPGKPVKVNDTWDEPRTVSVKTKDGAVRELKARRLYKLLKVEDGIAEIEVTYQVLSPMDPVMESQLVQRLMKGVVQFDLALGRPISQHFEVDKRVIGFAGPTSTMHYLMRMEEKLLDDEPEIASRPTAEKGSKN